LRCIKERPAIFRHYCQTSGGFEGCVMELMEALRTRRAVRDFTEEPVRITPSGGLTPMKEFPLSKVYQLLEPGPVVLLTTARGGRANVMTMSWHMMVEFTPPLVACVVSNADHSFAALRATKQCVIGIPAVELASKVVAVGNCSGRDVDKFETIGLTQVAAQHVEAPLIAECFANLECKVADTRLVNKYNLFVLEVLKAWTDPAQTRRKTIHHCGYGKFVVDGETITLESKMP
jgi:flavin reductase (DIM6/NTAB) family NADH-FMN oxidoreductase RutF